MDFQKKNTIRKSSFILLYILVFLFVGCSKQSKEKRTDGTEIVFNYAKQIKAYRYPDHIKLDVLNPWDDSKILQTYFLVPKGKEFKTDQQGILIHTPLDKSVIYASVHCALLDEINAYSAIAGVCDLKYINMKKIHEDCQAGKIIDMGEAMNPDIEKIMDLRPDALFISPFENSGGHGRVEKLGIPIFECADYMENTSLGRAEWIKVYGMMFGKENEADSIFTEVENTYLSLCEKAKKAEKRPSVLYGLKNGSAWYVPGGACFIAQLIKDAGANYIFKEDNHSGSVPLSFETVFNKGCDAEFWLFTYNLNKDKTYQELKTDCKPYSYFKAFKDRNIYAVNTGAVPYYEETPYHPEKILKDMIFIFHPETLEKDDQLQYFSKLAE